VPSAVESPCVGICRLRAGSRICDGCLRTVAEITEWSTAGDERRQEILRQVAARRAASGADPADPDRKDRAG
jgi:predicted Fe-S protein YdhL (DUF1289 family)